MTFENNKIEGKDNPNTVWIFGAANDTDITETIKVKTYNCQHCETQVDYITGTEDYPSGFTNNKLITDGYYYGNAEWEKSNQCNKSCVNSCFNTTVSRTQIDPLDNGWIAGLVWEHYACLSMHSGSEMPDVQCTGMVLENEYTMGYMKLHVFRTDDGNIYCGEWPTCTSLVHTPMKNVTIGPFKNVIFCNQTVDCTGGVSKAFEDPNSPLYERYTFFSERERGHAYEAYLTPKDASYKAYCTNTNRNCGTEVGIYTNIGQGYCPSCNGCNSGCTAACVSSCVTSTTR